MKEELEAELRAAARALPRFAGIVSHFTKRRATEQRYSQAYSALVSKGFRPKLRAKYRP